MPDFTAQDVKKLRDATGVGMMDAKKALDETGGNHDDAIRSGTLMCRIISDAVKEGRFIGERRGTVKVQPAAPSPEEEAERARQQAEARAAAARAAAEREARVAANVQSAPVGEVNETVVDASEEPNEGAIPAPEPEAAAPTATDTTTTEESA